MPTNEKQNTLLPVYLVVGEDELKKQTVLARLEKRLAAMGDLAFNSERFNGETATGDEIVNACNTLPFASEVRLVRVDNAEKLRKADSELLIDYLSAPCATTVLMLVATKLAKGTRLYKAIEAHGKQAVIDCAPLNRRDLNAKVQQMGRLQGIQVSPGAASALIDLVGTNTIALDSELRKIALAHRGNDPVNENEVYALVSRTAEVKPWEFIDAFSSRNIDRCLSLLAKMGKTSPHALHAMCTTRVRDLLKTKALISRGEQASLAKALKLPDWKTRNFLSWARNYSNNELIAALASSIETEKAMKSGADPDDAFLDWVLGVMKRR